MSSPSTFRTLSNNLGQLRKLPKFDDFLFGISLKYAIAPVAFVECYLVARSLSSFILENWILLLLSFWLIFYAFQASKFYLFNFLNTQVFVWKGEEKFSAYTVSFHSSNSSMYPLHEIRKLSVFIFRTLGSFWCLPLNRINRKIPRRNRNLILKWLYTR